jgi:small subunit ribosomal protein S16
MQRIGRRNDPAFRILVLEKTSSPKAGTYTDLLGTYNPKTKALTIAEDRLKEWMSKGAQLSDSLSNLLITKKVIQGEKVSTLSKKNLEKNVAKKAEEAAAAAEAAAKAEAAAEAAKAEPAPEAEAAPEEAAPVVEEAPAEAPAKTPAAEETPAA